MKPLFSLAAVAATLTLSVAASAQEQATTASSTGSMRPIPASDQMFRKSIWRAVDLREKQNKPMFSEGKEISRVIIEAVKRGELQAYKNDSLTSTFTVPEVSGNMSYAEEGAQLSAEEAALGFSSDDLGGGAAAADDGWGAPAGGAKPKKAGAATKKQPKLGPDGKPMKDRRGKVIMETVAVAPPPKPAPTSFEYRYKDLYQMELKEDMIFDKKRSRMYHDIKSVTLLVPSTLAMNKSGTEKPVGVFKYSDLVKVFRNNPQNAIWFNSQNDAQHKNLADAFELWLFNSYITKVSNPGDSRLSEVYGTERDGILAAQQTAADLVEYEYNLWSF